LQAIDGQRQLVPQLVVSFAIDEIEEVQALTRQSGVRSLRIFPNSHGYPLVHWIADEWFGWMAREGMALWIPMGRSPEVDARDLYDTASRYPEVPIVLAAISYSNYPVVWPLLKRISHLYVDLSRFDLTNGVERLIRHIGVHRLLFGSDFPEVDPKPYLYYLERCGLQPSELKDICHDNLQRMLSMGGS
jgi:predicted TIM-barrel fold metal-dependent hydrolase